MIWKILERVVNLTFMLLAVVLIVLLLLNSERRNENDNLDNNLNLFKGQMQKVISNNLEYLEKRVNKSTEEQDSYQNSSSLKLDVIEKRMDRLEQQNKIAPRIINNNQSSAVVNIPSILKQ